MINTSVLLRPCSHILKHRNVKTNFQGQATSVIYAVVNHYIYNIITGNALIITQCDAYKSGFNSFYDHKTLHALCLQRI